MKIIKNYLLNLIVVNILSIVFLFDTTSFDQGLISYQSLIYSLNKYLIILFATIESLFSYFDTYGVSYEIFWVVFIKIESLNYHYISSLFTENIKYFFFLLSILLFIFYKKKLIIFFLKIFNKKYLILISIFPIIILFIALNTYVNLKPLRWEPPCAVGIKFT